MTLRTSCHRGSPSDHRWSAQLMTSNIHTSVSETAHDFRFGNVHFELEMIQIERSHALFFASADVVWLGVFAFAGHVHGSIGALRAEYQLQHQESDASAESEASAFSPLSFWEQAPSIFCTQDSTQCCF